MPPFPIPLEETDELRAARAFVWWGVASLAGWAAVLAVAWRVVR